jgi:proteolipid membrane potential modulator
LLDHKGKSLKEPSVDLLRSVVAILLPPLGVFLQVGISIPFQKHKTL